jgi:hypothetical protein
MIKRQNLKEILGDMPLMMNMYWHLMAKKHPWNAHYNLNGLKPIISQAVIDAQTSQGSYPQGKHIFLFASLHYWIEQTLTMGIALAGMGHQVSFGYLPYSEWQEPVWKFDLRKQDLYTQEVLRPASKIIQIVPFINVIPSPINKELEKIAHEIAVFDTQYTLQVEEISIDDKLYQLRYERDLRASRAMYAWLSSNHPDLVIVPNGTIHELGVLYKVSQMMGIDTVTFEFSEQKGRIWLAQNSEIMRQDTDNLWRELGSERITEEHHETIVKLYEARKNARIWRNFARKWQQIPTEGAQLLRKSLGLDQRPLVLLATNVLGDSLTLGRQVISQTMAEWIKKTIGILIDREDIQTIIRIHPGEILTRGTSLVEVINKEYPNLPKHIKMIGPNEKINTYDLIEIADVGLVYTTTVGLEMSMAGIPVIVAGETHYRAKGFTYDPANWPEYVSILEKILADHKKYRLNNQQVELAWRYAYLFFFEYPMAFPWHLYSFKEDMQSQSMAFVLSEEGQRKYGETFRFLAGEKMTYRFRH